MQVQHSTQLKASVGVIARAQSSIKMNSMAFKILSSGLYSDKIGAPIREIGCNAADAHIAAGIPDEPFIVKLPTVLSPEFSIRDHGPGLTHEEVMTVYQQYFHSTKDTSDEYTGCMGLGSKSPRAYADQFTIKVVQDGVMRIYVCADDEDGVPSVSLVLETAPPEDWKRGVEVSMPVKPSDFTEFASKAQDIFQWFRVTPTVAGGATQISAAKIEWEFGRFRKYERDNGGWKTMNGAVVMGNVMYPINYRQLQSDSDDEYQKALDQVLYGIYLRDLTLEVPIGTVEVTASRESIEYTPRTIRNMRTLVDAEMKRIAGNVASYLDSHPDLSSGAIVGLYSQLIPEHVNEAYFLAALRMNLSTAHQETFDVVRRQTIPLDGWKDLCEQLVAENKAAPSAFYYNFDDKGRRRSSLFDGEVYLKNELRIVVNDRPVRFVDRLRDLMVEDKTRHTLVFGSKDPETRQRLMDLLSGNSIPVDFMLLSGQPKPPPKVKGARLGKPTADDRLLNVWMDGLTRFSSFEPPPKRIGDIPLESRYYIVRYSHGWGRRSIGDALGQTHPSYVFDKLVELAKHGFAAPTHVAVVTEGELVRKKLAELGFKPLDSWLTDVFDLDPRVLAHRAQTLEPVRVEYNDWNYNRAITKQIYHTFLKGPDSYAGRLREALAGTSYLADIEALLGEHKAANDRAAIYDVANANDELGQFLDSFTYSYRRATTPSILSVDGRLTRLQAERPRLEALSSLPERHDSIRDFYLTLLAMAVADTVPDQNTTAEENE